MKYLIIYSIVFLIQVEISVNDVEVDLQMKLGQAGEAFFVEAAARKESVPYNLATSPIPSVSYLDKFHFQKNDLHVGNI